MNHILPNLFSKIRLSSTTKVSPQVSFASIEMLPLPLNNPHTVHYTGSFILTSQTVAVIRQ